MNYFARHDGGHGSAAEGVPVKRRVARFARGVRDIVGPLLGGGENRDVGRLAGGESAFDAKDASRAGREELDHAHEWNLFCVYELFERERDGRFETENAEGRAVEFDVFESGLVRRVVGGDHVNRAVGDSGNECFAVLT